MQNNNQTNKSNKSRKEYLNADELINQALQQDRTETMSDNKFEQLWSNAMQKRKKITHMRIRYYAAAAVIALLIGISGVTLYQQTEIYMESQYQQGMMALNKVSKYLNVGMDKLQPVQEMNKPLIQLQRLKEPTKAINKLEQVESIPLKNK